MDAGQAARIYKRRSAINMPAQILPIQSLSWPGPCVSSWQGMPGILENYIKRTILVIRFAPVEVGDIKRANRLLHATAIIALLVFCLLRVIVLLVFARFGGM